MEVVQPAAQHGFSRDLRLVQTAIRSGVVSSRASAVDKHWDLWTTYCNSLHLDPFLSTVQDPVPILQVFGQRY